MHPLVYHQPVVALYSTGSELVEPDQQPLPHQIRNSNGYQLAAQLDAISIPGQYMGIISDHIAETEQKLRKAFETSDLVILTGGVSAGDSDFIPEVLKQLDFEILITRSAIQPGKPILFARRENNYCFGLAGNPVSSFIQFELYVKPFIYASMGYHYSGSTQKATLGRVIRRKKADRLKFIPGILNSDQMVSPVEFHGSAHIDALSRANCLIDMPVGVVVLNQGEHVDVRPL
jgi:molybdopterin molybdotransferase